MPLAPNWVCWRVLSLDFCFQDPMVIAPHAPSLCLFGCLCLFVSGLVPFWALRESVFLLLFCGVCWRLILRLNTLPRIKEAIG